MTSQSAENEVANIWGQEKKFLTLKYSEFRYLLASFNYLQWVIPACCQVRLLWVLLTNLWDFDQNSAVEKKICPLIRGVCLLECALIGENTVFLNGDLNPKLKMLCQQEVYYSQQYYLQGIHTPGLQNLWKLPTYTFSLKIYYETVLFPLVNKVYKMACNKIIGMLLNCSVNVVGDGHCNSPGNMELIH